MADEPMTGEEARRRFVAYLIEVDARGPAPDCEEQLAAIFAEHETECDRLEREQMEAERQKRLGCCARHSRCRAMRLPICGVN